MKASYSNLLSYFPFLHLVQSRAISVLILGDNPPVAVMLGDAPHQPDDNTHMPSRSDAAAHVVEHNQMANDEAGASFQPGNDNIQQHVEGTLSDTDSEGMF